MSGTSSGNQPQPPLSRVRLELSHTRALLTFAHAATRNAIDPEMIGELGAAMNQAELWCRETPTAVGLVLAGGEAAFVSGANLKYLASISSPEEMAEFSRSMQHVLNRLEDFPLPVIAAMEGPALGGGTEVALACDIRVLGARSYFSFKYARVGVVPGWGGARRLAATVGRRQALLLLTTASAVDAEEAARVGLADRLVVAGRAQADAEALVARMAELAPLSVRAFKGLLRTALGATREEAQRLETAEFVRLWACEDHKEGLRSLLEKREPRFRGR